MGSVGWLAGKAQIKRARAKSKPSPAKHTESTATTNAKFHDDIHFEGSLCIDVRACVSYSHMPPPQRIVELQIVSWPGCLLVYVCKERLSEPTGRVSDKARNN